MISTTLPISAVVIFLAVLYSTWYPTVIEVSNPTETNIIVAWKKLIKPPSKKFEKLVIG